MVCATVCSGSLIFASPPHAYQREAAGRGGREDAAGRQDLPKDLCTSHHPAPFDAAYVVSLALAAPPSDDGSSGTRPSFAMRYA